MSNWPFGQGTWVIGAALGSLFFAGLTLYYALQKRTRPFAPATFVIALGCVSGLTRSVIVSHFSGAGGIWRLLTVLLLIGGGIMYQREWDRMKRGTQRDGPEG
jgi:hypothetical protein